MHTWAAVAALVALVSFNPPTALGWDAPAYNGFSIIWSDHFDGAGATLPGTGNWQVINGDLHVNNELEIYTASPRNVQLSGSSTLQLIPLRDGSRPSGWSSGRVESNYAFTPAGGKVTRAEASLRFGTGGNRAGLWPAFWLLGESMRHGTPWPQCGEIDVMESVNGDNSARGTVHCDVAPGGICLESTGITTSTDMPSGDWHIWRIEWDLTPNSWTEETLTWYLDGDQFKQVSGAQIGSWDVWNALAHSDLYFILNLAVGGSMPGDPSSSTIDGFDAMLEVGYVALYFSN